MVLCDSVKGQARGKHASAAFDRASDLTLRNQLPRRRARPGGPEAVPRYGVQRVELILVPALLALFPAFFRHKPSVTTAPGRIDSPTGMKTRCSP